MVCLAHLEEDAGKDKDEESDNLGGIKGVTEEFVVHLARAIKDTQVEEKNYYHCSSPEHFICNCLLVKTLRENAQLNSKEGTVLKKGAWTPVAMVSTPNNLQTELSQALSHPNRLPSSIQTPFDACMGLKM